MDCPVCGDAIPEKRERRHAKTCSNPCGIKRDRAMGLAAFRKRNPKYDITRTAMGAVSELRVCCDLIAKGYEVFRNVSAHGKADLLTWKDGTAKSVEVKTSYRQRGGGIHHPTTGISPKVDWLALALKDGTIEYRPIASPLGEGM